MDLGKPVFEIPDAAGLARVVVRLLVAVLLGGALGYERERAAKAAGLRTHILVALGSALFVLAAIQAGMSASDVSRVIQGIVAGIGFLGAGAILKLVQREEVQGLTTAANIWFTAAIGTAVGCGHIWLPTLATVLALIVLAGLVALERRVARGAAEGGSGKRG